MQLGKFHPVELPIWGELSAFCDAVVPNFKGYKAPVDQISELAERWKIWRDEKQTRLTENSGHGIHSVAIFDVLSKICPEDAIIACDVGNNTYSFGATLKARDSAY